MAPPSLLVLAMASKLNGTSDDEIEEKRSSYKDDFSLFGNEPFKNWIELSTTERGGHVTKSL